ncbi:pyruvate, water dikinase regulatory protein [Desemzia sp. FAM 24101]|uniref:pyruvate, water dikinase regulatory protein n=1 Tax=unclassified Desemzia TaxID=2685243 RepID=UPI00388616E9
MEINHPVDIYIVSDSVGGTANSIGKAAMAQFPSADIKLHGYPFIRGEDTLISILEKAQRQNAMVLHTLVSDNLSQIAQEYCSKNAIFCVDLLSPVIREIQNRSGIQPLHKPGALHEMDQTYFDRIKAIEFAVTYDDGRDPKGFLEADIVLLGISRTSKTPLSMFLANLNYKVANLPLVPESHIPEQLWQVDPKKIVGLTNNLDMINSIRKERMIAYGLNPDTPYSNKERIEKELAFSNNLYEKLGCLVINVEKRSIEETAAIIVSTLQLDKKKQSHIQEYD